MILPSDSDPPPDRNHGDNPPGDPEENAPWWEDSGDDDPAGGGDGLPDDLDELPDDLDDPNAPQLQSVAGPGWRNDLFKDLIESLRDLEAIEDPDDEFAPPEPPDLYTFFGELAALRHELRDQGQRSLHALNKLVQTLPAGPEPPAGSVRRKGKAGAEMPGGVPWPVETCLALVSAWDLLPQASHAAAFETSLQPLLQAAGLTRTTTVGRPFDPATMTLAGQEPAPAQTASGTVLRETAAGFLRAGTLLRPAAVITAA